MGRPLGAQMMLGVAPGLALIVLPMGILTITGPSLAPLLVPLVLFGFLLDLAGMFSLLPRWWGPRWYRELPASRRDLDPARSPIAAAMLGFGGRPGVVSAREAKARVGRVKPVASWRGGWVYDPDTDKRVHAMSRKGTIDGRLTLYPSALVFAASRAEDVLRAKSNVLVISTDEISEVHVVPPRAGADGRPRRGTFYRSWFPRVVVRTEEEAFIFDVAGGQARKVAEQLLAGSSAGPWRSSSPRSRWHHPPGPP